MIVVVDERKTFVHTGGSELAPGGELVLLIHGAGNDHVIWRFATRRLAAAGWSVAAADLPAHGASAGPALGSIEDMAAWCLRLATALGFEEVTPIGHSMGSLVAMEMATQAPERVHRVGLVATASQLRVHPDLQEAAERMDQLAADLIVGWTHSGRSRFGHHDSAGMWMPAVNRRLLESNAASLARDLEACVRWDGAESLAVLAKDVLVVTSEHDRMIPARGARQLAAEVGARVVEISGGSHASVYDHPDEVMRPLMAWLSDEISDSD